jgi:hypothetical protein
MVVEDFARRVEWFRARDPATEPACTSPRERHLQQALHLDELQLRFVWACVCAAADPALQPALVVAGGPDARKGLSLSAYAALTGEPAVGTLAAWLASDPLILRLGLLAPADTSLLPGSVPYVPAPRLVSYLAGSDALDPAIARTGGVVAVPARYELDREHRELIDRLAASLAQLPPPLVVLVGPRGMGRRTMVAAAVARAGRPTVMLDGKRVLPEEDLVHALYREALLLDAVPVIADVDELAAGEHRTERLRRLARAIDSGAGPARGHHHRHRARSARDAPGGAARRARPRAELARGAVARVAR